MHNFKIIGLLGMALAANIVIAKPVCNGEAIVVTVSAPAVTETVIVPFEKAVGAASIGTAPVTSQASILTDITATLTSYVTLTEFVSVVHVTSTTSVSTEASTLNSPHRNQKEVDASKGAFFFFKHDGTLEWLDGKTPPAGRTLLTSAAFITVQPVPTGFDLSAEGSVASSPKGTKISTTYSTVEVQSTIYQTKVTTSTLSTPSASLKEFAGLGSTGWNTSFTSPPTIVENKVAVITAKPILGQTGVIEKGIAESPKSSSLPNPVYAVKAEDHLQARQLGALVVATIDGAIVSWINTFDGPVPSPEPLISWINVFTGPFPEATPSSSALTEEPTRAGISGSDHESVDLPTYPWDLAFSVSQTTPPEPTRIASTQSSHTPIEAPVDQVNPWDSTPSGAIYPWDLTPPISPTNSSDSHRTVPSVSLSQTTSASGPEKLAIYPLDSTPPQPRTTFPKSGDVSVFISSQTPVDRSKSTFSTVTRQLVTSVLSFTSVQPTASRGASAVESLRSSKNFNAVPKCDGQRNSPSKFTLSFDDLPSFSAGPNTTDIPPLFNPYRKLYFEDHFGYVPPPSVPFLPHSPGQLAVYRAEDGLDVNGSPDAGLESVGEFGSGPRSINSAFWIDAFSFWIGCENEGPSDCEVNINGYELASSTRIAYKDVAIPPCPGLKNCQLTYVELGEDFRNLTGVQILASVDRRLVVYYLDDVSLGWSNNLCAAQKQRSTVR